MHSRLALAALLVPTLLISAPADAASRKPVARKVVAKVVTKAPVARTAERDYAHRESLDFSGPSRYPVLYPQQHCSGFYVVRDLDYFNGPVLICG